MKKLAVLAALLLAGCAAADKPAIHTPEEEAILAHAVLGCFDRASTELDDGRASVDTVVDAVSAVCASEILRFRAALPGATLFDQMTRGQATAAVLKGRIHRKVAD